ncbi:hypothetical protein [Halalkalibacillus halophilus]|uniref:hypothetical protein n=1 Tax=Halalkalibacillus halophilus TaxID=392827 RepID=UPI000405886B|nr:hypothetical protein [Halalkalibacillus halophilus]
MWIDWLIELGFGVLWMFTQPLLYLAVALSFWTSYKRVKADRREFGHRVYPYHAEWHGTWKWGMLFGLLLSIGLIIVGVMFTLEFLLLWSLVTIILAFFNRLSLLSPAYSLGLTIAIIWMTDWFNWVVINQAITDSLLEVSLLAASYLLVGLLVAEITLVYTTKRNQTFPALHKGDRGKFIGLHYAKRLMFIPIFIPISGGAATLEAYFAWWPIFSPEGSSFSFILFPYLIGFSQYFKGIYADLGTKKLGHSLLVFFVLTAGLGVGLYFEPVLVIGFIGFVVIGRFVVYFLTRSADKEKRPIFAPQAKGIIIVGVTPGSPADDMGLIVGEQVEKVHGIPVSNEHEFYDVMTENRTYCKLSIRDLSGEIRFVQRALYENEHHELGIIFVKETPRFTLQSEKQNISEQ